VALPFSPVALPAALEEIARFAIVVLRDLNRGPSVSPPSIAVVSPIPESSYIRIPLHTTAEAINLADIPTASLTATKRIAENAEVPNKIWHVIAAAVNQLQKKKSRVSGFS
jgi:hypothetical protein